MAEGLQDALWHLSGVPREHRTDSLSAAFCKRRAARSVNELWDAIGEATDNFTPAECQNYFAAAGYDHV